MLCMATKDKTVRSGRPPKFREPHHPVTMTLPKRILDQLAQIDPDRAQAVVKVTEAIFETERGRFKPVELVEMAPGKSLIVVGPSKALEQIPWLKRIEISQPATCCRFRSAPRSKRWKWPCGISFKIRRYPKANTKIPFYRIS